MGYVDQQNALVRLLVCDSRGGLGSLIQPRASCPAQATPDKDLATGMILLQVSGHFIWACQTFLPSSREG